MPRPSTEVNGPGSTATPSVRSSHHEKFAGRWKKFDACVKGVAEFSQHIGTLEDTLDLKNLLELELRSKNAEIMSYKAGRQQMLEGFAESDRIWKEKESKLAVDLRGANSKVKSLEGQLAALKRGSISTEHFKAIKDKAAEVQALEKTLNVTDKKLKRLEDELANKSTLLIGSEKQLKTCRKELEERMNETGLGELSADFSRSMMDLSMRFHDLAKKYFFTTLPKELNVVDDVFIELQRSRFMNSISRPIPISNTQASKHLRMAAAATIIAKKLCEELSQPLSILDLATKDGLDKTLDQLFNKSPRQEAILRCLLLAAHASDERVQETRIVKKAFKSGLETLLRDAMELWSEAQRSPERILASTEGKNWNWGFHKEHDEAVSLTAAQIALTPSSEEPLMTLFPRIYSLGTPSSVHNGFSLWSDQSVVVAGDLESKEQVDRVNSRNGHMTSMGGKRKTSVSNPTGSLFHQRMKSLSSSPRSPKA